MEQNKYWYAVEIGNEDTDWGTGSLDFEEALKIAEDEHKFNPGERITVVTVEEGNDPIATNIEVVHPSNVDLLRLDGCTESEADKHLANGTTVFDDDLERNLESYLSEWFDKDDEDEQRMANEIRIMVKDGIPAPDWGVVYFHAKRYYIQYVL